MNPTYACPDDTDTVESLSSQVEEMSGKLSALMQFVNDQFDACPCEHCGQVHPRKDMLAVYGLDVGNDGKPRSESSRWFCGFCCHAAIGQAGIHQQECRDRFGNWIARSGQRFLSKYSGPVTEFLIREYAPEITAAKRRMP